MDNRLDRETAEIVRSEKNIEDLCKHEAWPQVRQKFTDKVMDLQSVRNISEGTPEQMVIDMKARLLAIDILLEWMREIEGSAQTSKDTSYLVKRESYIIREVSSPAQP